MIKEITWNYSSAFILLETGEVRLFGNSDQLRLDPNWYLNKIIYNEELFSYLSEDKQKIIDLFGNGDRFGVFTNENRVKLVGHIEQEEYKLDINEYSSHCFLPTHDITDNFRLRKGEFIVSNSLHRYISNCGRIFIAPNFHTPSMTIDGSYITDDLIKIKIYPYHVILIYPNKELLFKCVLNKVELLVEAKKIGMGPDRAIFIDGKNEIFFLSLTPEKHRKEMYFGGNLNYSGMKKGNHYDIYKPIRVDINNIDSNIIQIECSKNNNILLTDEGKIYEWGNKLNDESGNKFLESIRYPIEFTGVLDLYKQEKVVKVFLGYKRILLITNNSRIFGRGELLDLIFQTITVNESKPIYLEKLSMELKKKSNG